MCDAAPIGEGFGRIKVSNAAAKSNRVKVKLQLFHLRSSEPQVTTSTKPKLSMNIVY